MGWKTSTLPYCSSFFLFFFPLSFLFGGSHHLCQLKTQCSHITGPGIPAPSQTHCAPGPAARGGQEEMRSLVGCLPNKMPSDFGSSLMHVVAQHVLDTPCTVSPPQSPKVDSPMLKAWIRTAWGKEGGRNTETAHHESIIIGWLI